MGEPVQVGALRAMAFPAGVVGDADIERWGFAILHLVFEAKISTDFAALGEVTAADAREALAQALGGILWRARGGDSVFVCTGKVEEDDVSSRKFGTSDDAKAFILENIEAYASPGGVMLFVYSLMLSRTLDKLCGDMDDATQGLTGQFGHCTQELMNLLLCGVAASQVHDGTVDLGGGMMLRGVPERPLVGYLTHLEALRYCQVGTFYKKPRFPIWVVGSDSHYTVLFGLDKSLNDESMRTLQLNKAKRAFAEQDQQENGFVAVEKVSTVLRKLDLELSEQGIATFISRCEMPGSGIVLWNNFWTNVKPLLVPRLAWACTFCTFNNDKDADLCEMCQNARTDDIIAGDDGQEGEDDNPHTIDMVHINGLISSRQGVVQGPRVTPFKLTTVSRDLQAPSTHGHGVPMEEVLHTRWPGSVFLWPNDQAPSING